MGVHELVLPNLSMSSQNSACNGNQLRPFECIFSVAFNGLHLSFPTPVLAVLLIHCAELQDWRGYTMIIHDAARPEVFQNIFFDSKDCKNI